MGSGLSPACPASSGLVDFRVSRVLQSSHQLQLRPRPKPCCPAASPLFPPQEEQSPCSRGLQASTSPYLPLDTGVAMVC